MLVINNGVARTLKVTHIKGRLLDQAMILFNCVPFQNGNWKEFAPRRSESLLYEQFLIHVVIENHLYHIK